MEDAMRHSFNRLARNILAEGQDMAVATLCEDGSPHVTVVSYASDGLRIYFGCAASSLKARNLARDPRVAVTITLPYRDWSQIRGLSLSARARRLDGMDEIGLASELFLRKFPEAAQYVDEPSQSIRLYELTPTWMSILDYARGFGHTDRTPVEAADLRAASALEV